MVIGIDVSANKLAKTEARGQVAGITCHRADLERFLVRQVYAALEPRGVLVVSVEHPTFTAAERRIGLRTQRGMMYGLSGYLDEGGRVTNWLAEGVVKYHRMISTYVTMLLKEGFVLSALDIAKAKLSCVSLPQMIGIIMRLNNPEQCCSFPRKSQPGRSRR